jgi:hypothetical protein
MRSLGGGIYIINLEVFMWHGRFKLIIGLWLLVSGLIPSLHNPVNLVFIGFLTVLCCFRSFRLWQAAATGLVGFWLLLSGIYDWIFVGSKVLVNSINFFLSGIILVALGLWCMIVHSHEMADKGYLKVS